MKDDWQGNAGNSVIGQGDNQNTCHDFHELRTRWHLPYGSRGPIHSPDILMTYSDRPSDHTAFIWPPNANTLAMHGSLPCSPVRYQYHPGIVGFSVVQVTLPPSLLTKRKWQGVRRYSQCYCLSAGWERTSWKGFSDRYVGTRPVQTRAASYVVERVVLPLRN